MCGKLICDVLNHEATLAHQSKNAPATVLFYDATSRESLAANHEKSRTFETLEGWHVLQLHPPGSDIRSKKKRTCDFVI